MRQKRQDNIIMRLLRDPYDAFTKAYFALSPEGWSFKLAPYEFAEWFELDKSPVGFRFPAEITLHITEASQPESEAYWFKPLNQSVLALKCSDGEMQYMPVHACTGAYLLYRYPRGGWVSCS